MTELIAGLMFYFRSDPRSLHVRDPLGGHWVLALRGGKVVVPRGISHELRGHDSSVDLQHHTRASPGARADEQLKRVFMEGVRLDVMRLQMQPPWVVTTGWTELPSQHATSRWTGGRGMRQAMRVLFGEPLDALEYAQRLDLEGSFAWVLLLAHRMGGTDGPGNVVCSRQQANVEQLAIENLLCSYSKEHGLSLRVSAKVRDMGKGCYMGDVIEYSVRRADKAVRSIYLDCLAEVTPSDIQQESMLRDLGRWLNEGLASRSQPRVGRELIQQVIDAIRSSQDPLRR